MLGNTDVLCERMFFNKWTFYRVSSYHIKSTNRTDPLTAGTVPQRGPHIAPVEEHQEQKEGHQKGEGNQEEREEYKKGEGDQEQGEEHQEGGEIRSQGRGSRFTGRSSRHKKWSRWKSSLLGPPLEGVKLGVVVLIVAEQLLPVEPAVGDMLIHMYC